MKIARSIILVSLLLAPVCALGEAVDLDELDRWVTYYYLEPKPDRIPAIVQVIHTEDLFDQGQVDAPFVGFLTGVFQNNPSRISGWLTPYLDAPLHRIVRSALWMSDNPESKKTLRSIADDEAAPFLEPDPPSIETISVEDPADLDFLWGYFMATGSDTAVNRVIDEIPLFSTKGDIRVMMIGGAARWSISANARQHQRVETILRERASTATGELRGYLEEILSEMDEDESEHER